MSINDPYVESTLRKFESVCETLKWDRYTLPSENDLYIYGWIKRSDGNRDFLVVMFKLIVFSNCVDQFEYLTSSAKYSKKFSDMLWWGDGHSDCIKYNK